MLLTFEESAADLRENVVSLGFDLAQLELDGLLVVDAVRVDPNAGAVITGMVKDYRTISQTEH